MVLVVDDGSAVRITEDTLAPHLDDQIALKVINLETNGGITKALNTGLRWINDHLSVKYIARLDCADLCHDDRFYKQVEFFETHSKIGLVGTWCTFKDPISNFSYTYNTPVTHDKILKEMHYRNVFIHPTVMFRADMVNKVGCYPENYPHVEDYAFFWRIVKRVKTAVIPEVLVVCEINEKGISHKNRAEQLRGRYNVVSEFGVSLQDSVLGLLKLKLLMVLPHNFILKIKDLKGN